MQSIALNSLTKTRNIHTITLWQNPRNRLWINNVNEWLTYEVNEQRINDVMVKIEEAMKKWCHGKILKNSQKWCHRIPWSHEQLILWCNVLWETNKWLIRDFPKDLGIKGPILATQISSLFDSEPRTPSLVYAIFGLAFEVKLKLCLPAILALRMVVSAANRTRVSQVTLAAWVFRLKTMSMTCFLVNTSGFVWVKF